MVSLSIDSDRVEESSRRGREGVRVAAVASRATPSTRSTRWRLRETAPPWRRRRGLVTLSQRRPGIQDMLKEVCRKKGKTYDDFVADLKKKGQWRVEVY